MTDLDPAVEAAADAMRLAFRGPEAAERGLNLPAWSELDELTRKYWRDSTRAALAAAAPLIRAQVAEEIATAIEQFVGTQANAQTCADIARELATQPTTGQDQLAASRVWAFPPEPASDVLAVVDRFGQLFERGDAIDEHGSEPVWIGTEFRGSEADVPDLYLTWDQLMQNHAPLTEANPLPEES